MFEGSWISKLLLLNPMTHIINAYRDIMYYQQLPNMMNLGLIALVSFIIMIIGYKIFKKLEKGFAEEVW